MFNRDFGEIIKFMKDYDEFIKRHKLTCVVCNK